MKLLYDNSVQLRHVTSEIFTVFSLDCELILEVLEHAVLSSWHSHASATILTLK